MKRAMNHIAMALVFLLLGFLMAYQYRVLREPVKKLTVEETQMLLREIEQLKSEREELVERNRRLTAELRAFEEEIASVDEGGRILKAQLDAARLLLGLSDVQGEGVILTLKPMNPVLSNQPVEYLTDLELLYLVNELKFAGAEAVSINDKRLTAQSGLKSSAGNSFILVNDEKISPQDEIVIRAIGNRETLLGALSFTGALDFEALMFYDIRYQGVDSVEIPKFNRSFRMDFIEEGGAP